MFAEYVNAPLDQFERGCVCFGRFRHLLRSYRVRLPVQFRAQSGDQTDAFEVRSYRNANVSAAQLEVPNWYLKFITL